MYVICKYYIKIQRDGETLWSLHRESNEEFIDIAAYPLESGLDLWLFWPTECGKSDTVPVWNPVLKKLGVSISFLESDAMPCHCEAQADMWSDSYWWEMKSWADSSQLTVKDNLPTMWVNHLVMDPPGPVEAPQTDVIWLRDAWFYQAPPKLPNWSK